MRHIEDRQAVHDLLDVVLDAMVGLGDGWDLALDITNHGWNVRIGNEDEVDWRFFASQTSQDPIDSHIVEHVRKQLADANPHGDARL